MLTLESRSSRKTSAVRPTDRQKKLEEDRAQRTSR